MEWKVGRVGGVGGGGGKKEKGGGRGRLRVNDEGE